MVSSKKRFEETKSVDRRYFMSYVSKKLKYTIPFYHIQSVISILFEELLEDLCAQKQIVIGNFGKLFLKQLKPRKHFNVTSGIFDTSPGNKVMRFKLDRKLRKILTANLDIDKTFGDGYNE